MKKLYQPNRRVLTGIVLYIWLAALYFIPNHISLVSPIELSAGVIDRLIPLSPGWIWPYVSYYPFIVFAYVTATSKYADFQAERVIYAMGSTAFIGFLFFMLLPTTIDRSLYPIAPIAPGDGADNTFLSISVWALETIRQNDFSRNCAPSMHVGLSTIACLTYSARNLKNLAWALPWALAITYSTMATKQHYFIDVATGLLLGIMCFAIWRGAHGQKQR